MSFGINGPENIPAIQKSHQTTDGGAGNLGYFQQENKKKKKDEDEKDVFESSKQGDDEYFNDELGKELDSIGTRIKNFWLNINKNLKNNKKPESI